MQEAAARMEIAGRVSAIGVSSTLQVFADAERLRAAGADVVDFGAGEPDFPTPANVKEAALRAIAGNFTRYTNAGGTMELKEAVCERHSRDFGTSYTPDGCIITAGGKHAVFNLTQVLVNPGDEVIIPAPYWVTYRDVVQYAGGKCVFIDTDEADGFRLTAAAVERHITPRTRMVILNSPNNPSGAVIDRGELASILEIAAARGIFLLTDECYCQFLYDGEPFSVASLPRARNTVLVAGSLSKTYAMTGWRIGFVLAAPEVTRAVLKLQSHSTSNPTSISQKAAVEALNGPQDSVHAMLAEYRIRRDYVVERLRRIPGFTCGEPHGAFYAFPNVGGALVGGESAADFTARLLRDVLVAVVPGEAFGIERHIRISYATSMGELARGLDRMEAFVAGAR